MRGPDSVEMEQYNRQHVIDFILFRSQGSSRWHNTSFEALVKAEDLSAFASSFEGRIAEAIRRQNQTSAQMHYIILIPLANVLLFASVGLGGGRRHVSADVLREHYRAVPGDVQGVVGVMS